MARETKPVYEFGPFRLDARDQLLFRDGQRLPLTPKAVKTLVVLVEQPGHLIEKRELMERLWPDAHVEEGNLTFNITKLREALGDTSRPHLYIETVPRRGYRFVAPVTIIGPDGVPAREKEQQIQHASLEPRILAGRRRFTVALAVIAVIAAALFIWHLARTVPAFPRAGVHANHQRRPVQEW